MTYCLCVVVERAFSCLRNSVSKAVKFSVSVAVGNSQSILKPSNRPGAEMPGAMFPWTNKLMQEEANAWRPASVLDALTKAARFVDDAPPIDISTFRFGWSCLSC